MARISDQFSALIEKMQDQDRRFLETVDELLKDTRQAIEALDRIDPDTGNWV